MRVAELIRTREFQIIERPREEPAAGQLRVRVGAVGVCGSDLHNYSEGAIGDAAAVYPMVLGHEPSGTIDAVGPNVSGWSPGDRVFLEPAIYCYHCEYCRRGLHNVCAELRFMSLPGDPGFFRDYVIIPAHNVIALPEGVGLDEATLIEPLAVALHSLKFAAIQPRDTVAVFGAGPIGLLTIACLKLVGAGRVWAVDPVAHRREMALALGADAAIDPRAVDPAAEILRDTGHRGVDVAIDCAAKENTINQAGTVARHAGRVVLTGIHSDPTITLDIHVMRRKEVALLNVRRSNHESEAALELIREQPARFGGIVTHTRPLEQIADAFRTLEDYADGVGKMVVRVS